MRRMMELVHSLMGRISWTSLTLHIVCRVCRCVSRFLFPPDGFAYTLPLLCCAEYRCGGRRFLRRPGIRGQHKGGRDPAGLDGDDCFRKDILQSWASFLCDLPGELRRGRPHHNLLRRPQSQSSWSLREDGESESHNCFVCFFFFFFFYPFWTTKPCTQSSNCPKNMHRCNIHFHQYSSSYLKLHVCCHIS